jgi:hypothetical protein
MLVWPSKRSKLVQAAFDKLWVVGVEIAGADLKPGFVTLLDDELVAELERAAQERRSETAPAAADGLGKGTTYYRRDGSASLDVADLELMGIPAAEEDLWLPLERPSGRLPWEARDPTALCGVRGSNVDIWWS